MGQVTIYLEVSTEDKTSATAASAHLSKSKPVASMIKEKVTTEWPESIVPER